MRGTIGRPRWQVNRLIPGAGQSIDTCPGAAYRRYCEVRCEFRLTAARSRLTGTRRVDCESPGGRRRTLVIHRRPAAVNHRSSWTAPPPASGYASSCRCSIDPAGGCAFNLSDGIDASALIVGPRQGTGTRSHACRCDGTDGHMCRSRRHDLPNPRSRRHERAIVPVGRVAGVDQTGRRGRTMVIHRHPSAVERRASASIGGRTRTLAFDRRPSAVTHRTFA